MSPKPLFGFGSKFIAAWSVGVEEVGIKTFAAALAFVEKGQKASA
ncbi:MAG: hypothetical protein NTU85_00980 [Candidatus Kaiserbacteria bacterium]|nr:hypothetical protein [Candidatus Kaiserbacteria bacterium]